MVGSDGFYKGVPVFPLTKPLDIDLEIDIEYETVYMQPIDELVLSSLGKLLLKRNYPSFLSTPEKESFLHGLSSRSNVKALHIVNFHNSLVPAPSPAFSFASPHCPSFGFKVPRKESSRSFELLKWLVAKVERLRPLPKVRKHCPT